MIMVAFPPGFNILLEQPTKKAGPFSPAWLLNLVWRHLAIPDNGCDSNVLHALWDSNRVKRTVFRLQWEMAWSSCCRLRTPSG